MIKDTRSLKPTGMTTPESFDDYYRRKLDALKVELKGVVKDGIIFVVGNEYACNRCQGRLKWHRDGHMGCLLCTLPSWSQTVRIAVQSILERYPSLEQSAEEWKATHGKDPRPAKKSAVRTPRYLELGNKIREARKAKLMERADLARLIRKTNGLPISSRTLQTWENGWEKASEYAIQQIKDILGVEIE